MEPKKMQQRALNPSAHIDKSAAPLKQIKDNHLQLVKGIHHDLKRSQPSARLFVEIFRRVNAHAHASNDLTLLNIIKSTFADAK